MRPLRHSLVIEELGFGNPCQSQSTILENCNKKRDKFTRKANIRQREKERERERKVLTNRKKESIGNEISEFGRK